MDLQLKRILHGGGDQDADQTTNRIIQGISIGFIFILCLVFGFIPYFVKSFKGNIKLTGIANAFSCGIFLGVAIIHILPETVEDLEDYLLDNGYNTLARLPLCYFIAFFAYSLILFIEKVAFDSHALIEHEHEDGDSHGHNHNHNHEENKKDNKIHKEDNDESESGSETDEDVVKNLVSTQGRIGSFIKSQSNSIRNNNEDDKKLTVTSDYKASESSMNNSYQRRSQIVRKSIRSMNDGVKNDFQEVFKTEKDNVIKSKSDNISEILKPNNTFSSPFTPYLLLAALSFHGLFEGIALGLQRSTKSTISLLVAILGHKWAEALTLGLSFAKTGTAKPMFRNMIIIFSLFTPIGIGLGMILNSLSSWVSCIFMSLSVGTFLYIAASEIIVEEFSISRYKWIKILFMLIGAGIIFGMTIWELSGESDEEDHDH